MARNITITVILIISLSFIGIPIFAQSKTKKEKTLKKLGPKGSLVIKCNVDGAQVFIDGELLGETPLPKQQISVGEHSIKITKIGYTDYMDVIQILKGKTTTVEAELIPVSSYLKLKGNVKGARVFIDDTYIGNLPIDYELKPGEHTIVVKKLGYYDHTEKVTVTPGETKEIVINLEAMPMDERNPLYHPPPPPPKWYEKWWVWTAIGGGAVVLGGVITGIVIATSGGPPETPCGGNYGEPPNAIRICQ